MHGTRVGLARASATRELLTREVRQLEVIVLATRGGGGERQAVKGLVRSRTNITRVVGIWPLYANGMR